MTVVTDVACVPGGGVYAHAQIKLAIAAPAIGADAASTITGLGEVTTSAGGAWSRAAHHAAMHPVTVTY